MKHLPQHIRAKAQEIPPANVAEAMVLDRTVFNERLQVVRLLPAAFWRELNPLTVSAWCLARGRYGIPTMETIRWLLEQIEPYQRVVEIGAGAGDFAYWLGAGFDRDYLPTDSKIQDSREFQFEAGAMGQPTVTYPAWVEKIEALDAVKKYQPDCVFASWVTQKFDVERDVPGEAQAFTHGVDEVALLNEPCVKRYIMVGNMNSHGRKRARKFQHVVWRDERDFGLVSRAQEPHKNCIFDWTRP
jgi:hypothetical protein